MFTGRLVGSLEGFQTEAAQQDVWYQGVMLISDNLLRT